MTEFDIQLFKHFYYIVETLKIYGESYYGTSDVNVEALVQYLQHPSIHLKCWGKYDESNIEELVIQDIMDGMPVWRFFNLSPWAQEMQQRDWDNTLKERREKEAKQFEEDKKTYKCLQDCAYYDCAQTNVGMFVRCKAKRIGGDDFKLCKKCSQYVHKDDENKLKLRRGGFRRR